MKARREVTANRMETVKQKRIDNAKAFARDHEGRHELEHVGGYAIRCSRCSWTGHWSASSCCEDACASLRAASARRRQ